MRKSWEFMNACTIVREGSSYFRKGTSIGVYTSVLMHLALKHILQVIARLKFIL